MKLLKLVVLTMIFATSAAMAAEPAGTKPAAEAHPYTAKAPKLNRAQIDELLSKPDEVVIIDVRRPDEVSKIGGFPVYLSIQSNEIEKRLAFIPKERKLATVSNHAGRAGKSADLLVEKGFNVVGAIGAQDYEAEGGVLTKIQPPAPKPQAKGKH